VIAARPMPDFITSATRLAIFTVPLLLGVVLHELAHGYAAWLYGDPTAKNAGRLTLNPIKHLDKTGTLVFVLTAFFSSFVIGWAKPVPINPRYFRNPRQGIMVVSLAGPLANFALVVLFYIGFSLLLMVPAEGEGRLQSFFLEPLLHIFAAGVIVNAVLGVFNLLPIPPLDGSKILAGLLPRSLLMPYLRLEKYGFFILLLLLMTGALRHVFEPIFYVLGPLLHLN